MGFLFPRPNGGLIGASDARVMVECEIWPCSFCDAMAGKLALINVELVNCISLTLMYVTISN